MYGERRRGQLNFISPPFESEICVNHFAVRLYYILERSCLLGVITLGDQIGAIRESGHRTQSGNCDNKKKFQYAAIPTQPAIKVVHFTYLPFTNCSYVCISTVRLKQHTARNLLRPTLALARTPTDSLSYPFYLTQTAPLSPLNSMLRS
jgi:hypothetical protein